MNLSHAIVGLSCFLGGMVFEKLFMHALATKIANNVTKIANKL